MKFKSLFFFLIIAAVFTFCERDKYMSEGTITGPDYRMCACCGGYYITIDTAIYEFESLPADSKIDLLKESFPLNVKLDWALSDRIACPNKFITVTRITKE
jgi:hypothetical protein